MIMGINSGFNFLSSNHSVREVLLDNDAIQHAMRVQKSGLGAHWEIGCNFQKGGNYQKWLPGKICTEQQQSPLAASTICKGVL